MRVSLLEVAIKYLQFVGTIILNFYFIFCTVDFCAEHLGIKKKLHKISKTNFKILFPTDFRKCLTDSSSENRIILS